MYISSASQVRTIVSLLQTTLDQAHPVQCPIAEVKRSNLQTQINLCYFYFKLKRNI